MIDQLTGMVANALPQGIADDVKKNIDQMIRAALSRHNLVTRDEFEVQLGVLRRTREKVEALEQRVRELEVLVESSGRPSK